MCLSSSGMPEAGLERCPEQRVQHKGWWHLEAQVGKDKGLGQERRKLEEAAQCELRVGRDAVVGVVRMEHSREEERHDPRQLQHLHMECDVITDMSLLICSSSHYRVL